jgi:hypothetical protein
MRLIMLVVAIAGFAVAFTTTSPGLMGLGLVLGCGSVLGLGLALAASRIAQTAQPEATLIVDAEVNALRARAKLAKATAATTQPATGAPERKIASISDSPS